MCESWMRNQSIAWSRAFSHRGDQIKRIEPAKTARCCLKNAPKISLDQTDRSPIAIDREHSCGYEAVHTCCSGFRLRLCGVLSRSRTCNHCPKTLVPRIVEVAGNRWAGCSP